MYIIALFSILLALTFAAVWFMTRPTKSEVVLDQRLAELSGARAAGAAKDAEDDIVKHITYSDLPVVDAFLQKTKLADRVQNLITQANLKWTVGRLLFGSLALAVLVGWLAGLWFHKVVFGLPLGIAAGVAPYGYLLTLRSARLRRFNQLLPEAIDLMARALRAGHAVTAAIEMVAREIPDPVGMEFRRTFEEQNFGLPIREALLNLAGRVPIPDLKFLVTAMLVQKETGGNLAEILDKTGAVIRERARLLGQLRIYTAQGRLTGWILGLLPFIMFVLLHFVNPGYTNLLVSTPIGLKLVWAGLALMAIGIWIIRRIVDIKV
jgi:tight adherence protein B